MRIIGGVYYACICLGGYAIVRGPGLPNLIRSASMREAYVEEIEASKLEISSAKTALETWYAARHPEESIVDTLKDIHR